MLEVLRAWWRAGHTRGKMRPHGWLFPGQNPINPLSTRQLNHAAAEKAGIAKRVSLHTLRHYSAYRFMPNLGLSAGEALAW